jgi:hypothetical protein
VLNRVATMLQSGPTIGRRPSLVKVLTNVSHQIERATLVPLAL